MVRAKFVCDGIEPSGPGVRVSLRPVIGGSAENESFYKYTPGGSILLGTINAVAAAHFVKGREYYVDFTPAEQDGSTMFIDDPTDIDVVDSASDSASGSAGNPAGK